MSDAQWSIEKEVRRKGQLPVFTGHFLKQVAQVAERNEDIILIIHSPPLKGLYFSPVLATLKVRA